MQCQAWILVAVVLYFHSPYVAGRCLDLSNCMGLKSNEQIWKNNEEESLSLGLLLSALAPGSTETQNPTGEPPHSEERRSYSMEHFRWGKPMGRKRRPIKVFINNALEEEPEESTETFRVQREQGAVLDVQQRNNVKTNGKYRMTHFRWNTPPVKRYDAFMRPYSEHSQKPLLTLMRHR